MGKNTIQVVMVPMCAFGHMLPFFQLSIALAKSGIHVSYISTPKNIQRLPKIPSNLSHLLQFVEIKLPQSLVSNDLLPEDAESTIDIQFSQMGHLELKLDQMQHQVREFVSKLKPSWIICDFHPSWVVEIAQDLNVKLMFYSVFSSAALTFFESNDYFVGSVKRKSRNLLVEDLASVPECVDFQSSVTYKKYDARNIHNSLHMKSPSGKTSAVRFAEVVGTSEVVAVRSCYEIEGDYLNVYQKLIGKTVIPIGLMPPEMPERYVVGNETCGSDVQVSFEWLDKQAPKSVVFVGFGSECKLSKDQVFEIAYGLELSELPFLWALRRPSWAGKNDHDALPAGFGERTSKRGIVCMGWVPQVQMLAHPSTGGSLFHSGWGSAIEMLRFGLNLVVLPFIMDQPLNARLLVDKGLAIEVERGEDGSFSRDGIAKSLRQAMVLEEGEKLRAKTRDVAKVVGDMKLHEDYIGAFVHFLKTGIWKQI